MSCQRLVLYNFEHVGRARYVCVHKSFMWGAAHACILSSLPLGCVSISHAVCVPVSKLAPWMKAQMMRKRR